MDKIKKIKIEARKSIIKMLSGFGMHIASKISDPIMGITSLADIDLKRPCTTEEKMQIIQDYDCYVYKDALYDFSTKINDLENNEPDQARFDYSPSPEQFTVHTAHRLHDNYQKTSMDAAYEYLLTTRIWDNKLFTFKRKVIIEKIGHNRIYKTLLKTQNLNHEQRLEIRKSDDYQQDLLDLEYDWQFSFVTESLKYKSCK